MTFTPCARLEGNSQSLPNRRLRIITVPCLSSLPVFLTRLIKRELHRHRVVVRKMRSCA